MVKVNRLDGREIIINAELIETIEETPDTIITLTTGKRIIVKDPVEDIVQGVLNYRRSVYGTRGLPPVPEGE